jgi:hypothetical protein
MRQLTKLHRPDAGPARRKVSGSASVVFVVFGSNKPSKDKVALSSAQVWRLRFSSFLTLFRWLGPGLRETAGGIIASRYLWCARQLHAISIGHVRDGEE